MKIQPTGETASACRGNTFKQAPAYSNSNVYCVCEGEGIKLDVKHPFLSIIKNNMALFGLTKQTQHMCVREGKGREGKGRGEVKIRGEIRFSPF